MERKPTPTYSDIKTFEALYHKHGSLKIVAEQTGYCQSTIKKYVTFRLKRKTIPKSRVVSDWRRRTKQKLVDALGGCCKHCGYSKIPQALQFHHVDPKKKDFTISGKSWKYDKLLKEAKKCLLLCANCHIEEHVRLGLVAQW